MDSTRPTGFVRVLLIILRRVIAVVGVLSSQEFAALKNRPVGAFKFPFFKCKLLDDALTYYDITVVPCIHSPTGNALGEYCT